MSNQKDLIPKSRRELVVPVGKVKIIASDKSIDEALRAADKILNNYDVTVVDKNDKVIAHKPPYRGETMSEVVKEIAKDSDKLKKLTKAEIDKLPHAKYGRDEYGRSLTKTGQPRRRRSDIGHKRGARS